MAAAGGGVVAEGAAGGAGGEESGTGGGDESAGGLQHNLPGGRRFFFVCWRVWCTWVPAAREKSFIHCFPRLCVLLLTACVFLVVVVAAVQIPLA